jgi:uncharacterized protein YegP (UPF0339 family)
MAASTCEFEVYTDNAGQYRWRLQDTNHKVIADSGEGYTSKQGCLNGIEDVRQCAADAHINDKT